MHENASKPLDPPPGAYACYNIDIMTRDYFAKYMLSPQFQQDENNKEEHKKVCQKCRDGIIKFYFKQIIGRNKK
jgi:hypothetical protein